MQTSAESTARPEFDRELHEVSDYVLHYDVDSGEAWSTARHCLMDALACAMLALDVPACTRHLGPIVPGSFVPNGARVPGTDFTLDPVKAAWDIGCLIRWLDYNDTWLAAEWGHPSDNLGGILGVADHLARKGRTSDGPIPVMRDVLDAMIRAYEVQGVMALENSFNRVGLDHVVLVKVASVAAVARLMGANRDQLLAALSHAWVDGQSLRTYRHAPNTGSRKSWAAGDATSRAVRLVDLVLRGEMGIPGVLTAPRWGFYEVLFSKWNDGRGLKPEGERRFRLQRPYGSYVMENVLFKIRYPAEFHSQTACEAAIQLHPEVRGRLDEIERITIDTHESAIRIISKEGPLANAADRDHCLQYITAVGLLCGELEAAHYETEWHETHPAVDVLREKMIVMEDGRYSRDYHDPDKRSIANAVQVHFRDGTSTAKVEVEYPVGHRRRREEGIPLLEEKFRRSLEGRFPPERVEDILAAFDPSGGLETMAVDRFMDLFVA